ncbi:AMP-binding protein [Zhongshania sp.]|uniref:AMP-binding protein n=1 Tax=Zhongshania sp. TaxID=1971902 RepID=UPI0039E65005
MVFHWYVRIVVLLTYALLGGPVIVFINRRLSQSDLIWIIGDAKSQCLIMDGETAATLRDINLSQHFILKDKGNTKDLAKHEHCFSDWLEQQSSVPAAISFAADRGYLQVYTSGTSGFPKGVVLTQGNCVSQLVAVTLTLDVSILAGESMYQALPLFHVGGIFVSLMCLSRGATLQLRSEFNPETTRQLLSSGQVEHAALVPAMIQACTTLESASDTHYPKLKSIFYGASPISESALRAAHRHFGCDFVQIYGMTETHSVIFILGARDHRAIFSSEDSPLIGSAGRPIIGTAIKLTDIDGNTVTKGGAGEICVQSDLVMKEYWNNPSGTQEAIQNDFLLTGDVGQIGDSGHLFVVDRLKDIIVSGGENISSLEIESVLMQRPAIADVAVIGSPDEKWGEIVVAVIFANSAIDTSEIGDFSRKYLSGFKLPKKILFTDTIPRNAGGKILKKQLRKMYTEPSLG